MSRPLKYTDQQLKEILLIYAANNVGKKINPNQLAKETGIKRHVWSRRMKETIDKLNEPPSASETQPNTRLPLPNIAELIETHWNSKTSLIKALAHYNDTLQELYEQAINYHQVVLDNEKLTCDLKLKQEVIKNLSKERDYYKKLYMETAVKSTYKQFQEEGLKNIISINRNKEKSLSIDLVEKYRELFDD